MTADNAVPQPSPEKEYRLKSINIAYRDYGEDKGKYFGTIEFQNDERELFSFKIYPEMADKYLDLIGEEVARAASELGANLIKALRLKKKENLNSTLTESDKAKFL